MQTPAQQRTSFSKGAGIHKHLGKRAARIDHRTFKVERYLAITFPKALRVVRFVLPGAPATKDWFSSVPLWPMMLNDQLGDCTCAAAGHMICQWTTFAGHKEANIPDNAILKAHEAVSGYVPGEPQTDNGAVMLDVLNYWRQTGIGGHKITAFASVPLQRFNLIRMSISMFGSVYLGIQLPLSAQGQNIWEVPPEGPTGDGSPGSWGGHCVPIVGYDQDWWYVVTWGQIMKMKSSFLIDYADEAYVCLSPDWYATGNAPSGFNLAQLETDLSAL